jgi:F420-non-reducing hydrogenase iron-sulfur subunit
MATTTVPDVVVYVCANCLPQGGRLPRQWHSDGAHVVTHEVPCSGKIDGQYLMHALEGGLRGVCVVACPKGECHLAQGNYRAEIRVHTIQRLLEEIGLEAKRAELIHCSPDDPAETLEKAVRESATRLAALGESPLAKTVG